MPSPSFAIVQPYEELDPPVWHVDLYRIEDPRELDELGLDSLGRRACCWSNGPSGAGRGRHGREALGLSLDFADGGARRLTAQSAPGMGGAMAAPMIPPADADGVPRILRLGRRARSSRLPATLPSAAISAWSTESAQRGADGRAAAARGSAAVHRGRRMADRRRAERAARSLPATSTRGCCCSAISAMRGCANWLDEQPACASASCTSSRPTC